MIFINKVIVITGASSGIGAAAAKLFAEERAQLTLIGRNNERLQAVANVCESKHNMKPLTLLVDLTAKGSCEEVINKTIEKYEKIDVLVNCAGRFIITSLYDSSIEAFDDIFALNVRVPYRLTQLCVPHLVKTKGNIVNVIGAPLRTRPGFTPCYMMRDAMDRFTRTGGLELISEGVRMNAVLCGVTRTNFLNNFNLYPQNDDEVYSTIAKDIMPNNIILDPVEVARMIVMAASDTYPHLNASCLTLDGGASVL